MKTSLTQVGLPAGYKVLGLTYHEASRTLFTHVGPLEKIPPRNRLYFRGPSDITYQPIGEFPDQVSIDSFVLDSARPSLYFLTYTWKSSGNKAAGDWDGLYRFDLEEHRWERLARRGDLVPVEGYEKAWLCKLLAVSANSRTVFCKAGLITPLLEDGGRRADYWVIQLDLATMRLETVTQLMATFA